MFRSLALAALLCLLLPAAAGCGPGYGDQCGSNQDCGRGRICDRTVRNGYCTKTPCEEGECGDEGAVCIEFHNGETYCMKSCNSDGDCRSSHTCLTSMDDKQYCYVQ